MSAPSDDLIHEQGYVSALYGRLDRMRDHAETRLATSLKETGGTPQARSERDTAITMYRDQLAQFAAVESGLCFGRLDFAGGDQRGIGAGGDQRGIGAGGDQESVPRYIGRIGIFDDEGDFEPLLVDWRAPAARPFYLATAASPEGVRRRRHIRTRLRTVTELDDEVLDLDDAGSEAQDHGLASEAALLAAVGAHRTGRMRDIVETIQAEQDRIIRADLSGVLVVQGGPGTGKTAVALHRAAYLLYTYRQQLSTRGVLVVGPNRTFLRYISQVLPSLAETGVLLSTVGGLVPGVRATAADDPIVAEIKGRAAMVDVLTAAVADRQKVPEQAIEIDYEPGLTLSPEIVARARQRARRSGRLHNVARSLFEESVLEALTEQVSDLIGTDPYADDPLGGDDAPGDPHIFAAADLADIRRDLAADPRVRRELDELWPVLTPQQLLRDLFASPQRLAVVMPGTEGQLLHRGADAAWTPADVPLLDEAAELLGEDITSVAATADRRREAELEYARGALEIAHGSRSLDAEHRDESEILDVNDLLDAGLLAERHEHREQLTTAERAAADRRWAFGHVIVDEAQELSPMAWRLLMRRCPSRSMTLVGDVAQTGDLAGASSWAAVLEPFVADRWRLTELTVNYRTPAEIMAVAGEVLASIDPSLQPPRSVRESGVQPWSVSVEDDQLAKTLVEAVVREAEEVGDGRLGVIVPPDRLAVLGEAVSAALPSVGVGPGPASGPGAGLGARLVEDVDLERPVVVLTVQQCKGLEFDSVVVVDPDGILAASPRGRSDLYVALTRATQRLGILRPLPR